MTPATSKAIICSRRWMSVVAEQTSRSAYIIARGNALVKVASQEKFFSFRYATLVEEVNKLCYKPRHFFYSMAIVLRQ